MFIPKRHVVEMSELSVIETGELFKIYDRAVDVFKSFQDQLPEEDRTGKYIFFWRFRSERSSEKTDQRKLNHFHLHLAPDRERLFDPLLDQSAHNVNYIPLLNLASEG